MYKYIPLAAITLTPSLAQASTMQNGTIGVGALVLILPMILSFLITRKEQRWWWVKAVILVYIAGIILASLASGGTTVIIFVLFPYTLLPIALYKRWQGGVARKTNQTEK